MPDNALKAALSSALKYASERNIVVAVSIMVEARRLGIGFKAAPLSYSDVRGTYWAAVYDGVQEYLESQSPITVFRNRVRKAVADAFVQSGDIGYVDGGGELPLDEDTLSWLSAMQEAELGYVDAMFQSLKEARTQEDVDAIAQAFRHADGYANTLDMIYNGAKARGASNKMLTFSGDDGDESCRDCQRLKGKRHRAKWWIANDLVPPNRGFECGGYRCEHFLVDDDGERFTI